MKTLYCILFTAAIVSESAAMPPPIITKVRFCATEERMLIVINHRWLYIGQDRSLPIILLFGWPVSVAAAAAAAYLSLEGSTFEKGLLIPRLTMLSTRATRETLLQTQNHPLRPRSPRNRDQTAVATPSLVTLKPSMRKKEKWRRRSCHGHGRTRLHSIVK